MECSISFHFNIYSLMLLKKEETVHLFGAIFTCGLIHIWCPSECFREHYTDIQQFCESNNNLTNNNSILAQISVCITTWPNCLCYCNMFGGITNVMLGLNKFVIITYSLSWESVTLRENIISVQSVNSLPLNRNFRAGYVCSINCHGNLPRLKRESPL